MAIIKTAIIVFGISLVVALGACSTKPILNVKDAPIPAGRSLQTSQVRQAIMNAGIALGWQIADSTPGVLHGTLRLRDHTAIVEIPYTSSNYSIAFKSGINLGEKDGQIHKNYNGWVQNLDNRIQAELTRL